MELGGDCVICITFKQANHFCDVYHISGLIKAAQRFPGNT